MKLLKRSFVLAIGICLVVLLAACQTGTSTGTNQPYQPSGDSGTTQPSPTQPSGQGSNSGNGQGNPTTPFTITNIILTMSPSSINNLNCGSQVDLVYTAVFDFPAGNPGGTVVFSYTLNNGRAENPASVSIAPGQTSAQYVFHYKGELTPDHVMPGIAAVLSSSPNQVESNQIDPGRCQS